MRILYAGALASGNSCVYRMWALERLGHTVIPFDIGTYEADSPLLRKLEFRLSMGTNVARLNADLVRLAEQEMPDVFWADKVLKLRPETLDRMGALGIATVSYMIDNAFGPRRDPGWRLYVKDVPHFDLHVTQRDVSMRDYIERGARDVLKVQTAYEPTIHFPPPRPVPDADKTRAVSFIGTPYDDRADTLARLGQAGLPVVISGNPRAWARALTPGDYASFFRVGELYEQQYREAVWHSKINLSFLTHANLDEYTHKSFEIAGCGGFLLVERSPGHRARFVEDEEAVFFSGFDELKAKIERYLPDQAERTRIAAAGRARALRDGYDNDRQMDRVVHRVQDILDADRAALGVEH